MRVRALVAGVCVFVASCTPAPPPDPPPITIVGTLIDDVSGAPIADEMLRLGKNELDFARTAADGRFEFKGIRRSGPDFSATVHYHAPTYRGDSDIPDFEWRPVHRLSENLGGVETGAFAVYETSAPAGVTTPAFKLAGTVVDIGPVRHFHQKTADQALASLCGPAPLGGVSLPAGLAVLKKQTGERPKGLSSGHWDEWAYDAYLHGTLIKAWKPSFPAVVCVVASYRKAGEYTNLNDALQTTWRVTVLDAATGKRSARAFSKEPPPSIRGGRFDGFDSPDEELVSWLVERYPPAASPAP